MRPEKPWKERSVLKKYILGKPLNDDEKTILVRNAWEDIKAGHKYHGEESIWNYEITSMELECLKQFLKAPNNLGQMTLTNYQAYIKSDCQRSTQRKSCTIKHGDIVIIEGKYANNEDYSGSADLHIRLKDSPAKVTKRFKNDRAQYLNHDLLEEHMKYYDLVIKPSWQKYERRTRSIIDLYVNLKNGSVEGI